MKQSTLNNGGHETMTKRFLLANSDYDLKYEMRIADLTRVDKTKEDFFNEEEECYDYNKFLEYLYDNNAFLTKDKAEKVLNEQDQQIKQLKQEVTYRKEQFDVYQQKVIRTLEKEYNFIENNEHIPNNEKIVAKLEIEKLKEELMK